MLEFITHLFGKETEQEENRTQAQREALLDLLLLGMYADNRLSEAENLFLEDEMDELVWESPTSLTAYFGNAVHKVRDVERGSNKRQSLLQDIARRLGDAQGKQGAIQVLEDFLAVDGVVPEEHALLDEVRKIFSETE